MTKQVRILADHAFVGSSLCSKGMIVSVPKDLKEDWFEDASLPAPEPEPQIDDKPMALSELRKQQAPGSFIDSMQPKKFRK